MSWSDMPIRIDAPRVCPKCRAVYTHTMTVYKDAEYGVCHHCGTKTTWVPGQGELEVKHFEARDASRELYDFKRNDPRRYLPRQGKEDKDG